MRIFHNAAVRRGVAVLGLFLWLVPALAAPGETAAGANATPPRDLNADRLWVLLAAALVFLMQAGFLCVEVGAVQKKSVVAVGLKNVIDWVVAALVFSLVGFGFMFGHSSTGWLGVDLFGVSGLAAPDSNGLGYAFFIFQVAFAGTALTIISGAMSERTAFIPYLVCSALVGLVIYPVFGHWAWGNQFFAGNQPWLARLGFIDFAGSTVVHSVGGWVALVGAWMVGPRLGRYDSHGNPRALRTNNLALTALGVLLLWVGWWGFNGGSTLTFSDAAGSVIVNTNLAAAAAGLAAFFHCFFAQDRNDLSAKFLGGILGGLVAITACCHVVTPFGAVAVGLTAGILHNYGYDVLMKRLRIDDPVGAVPVHVVCGVWGTICVALFGQQELLSLPRWEQLGVQLLGVGVCCAWTTTTAWLMFKVLKMTVGLRVSPDIEKEGIDIAREFEVVTEKLDEEVLALMKQRELGAGSKETP